MKQKWHIESLYLYLVSFITLILIITGSINLVQTAIVYVTPLPENQLSRSFSPEPVPPKMDTLYYSDLDTQKLWEEKIGTSLVQQEKERSAAIARENSLRSLIRKMISALAYIAAAFPVYLYHWRKIPLLEEG